jgi:hypothetical protein
MYFLYFSVLGEIENIGQTKNIIIDLFLRYVI